MIVDGSIARRIGADIFIVAADGREYNVALNFRIFPEEFVRLHGHVCPEIGLVPGLKCQVDVEDGDILDIKFDLPNQVAVKEEISKVVRVVGNGASAFLERQCGCSLHISSYAILGNTSQSNAFDITQLWKHRVSIYKNKVEADKAHFIGMAESDTYHA
jgi:hypothetical protein